MTQRLRRIGLVFSLIGLIASGFTVPVYAAGTPAISASPSAQRVHNGDTLKLTLHLDPNGTSINTVNVVATYPADKLSFVGLDKSGAYFDAFIPAAPEAHNGTVTFAAAALQRGPTTDGVVVDSLLFKATADSGSASVSLAGTQAANGGSAIDMDTSDAIVNFDDDGATNSGSFGISNVKVSRVTTSGASVSWHTNTLTTGTVDYGSTNKYGLSASSDTPSMDHTVDLGRLFSGRTIVHFRVTAVDTNAATEQSRDLSFTTLGYPIRITALNGDGKPAKGVVVSVAGHTSATSGTDGTVLVNDVAPGTQKVVVGSGKAQVIVVKTVIGEAAEKPQTFSLKATSSTEAVVVTIVLLLLLIAAGIVLATHVHGQQAVPITKPKKA
jgi:hypothetical protein